MKKLSLLWAAAFAVTSMFITSCNDEDVDPVKPTIAMTVTGSASSFNVPAGSKITVAVTTAKGDKQLDKLTFRVAGNPLDISRFTVDGNASKVAGEYTIPNSKDAGANHVIEFTAGSTAGTEAIQIAIVDKDNLQASISVTVTVNNYTTSAITSTSAKLLGAQSNATLGSYLDASGTVISQTSATSASNIVLSFAYLTAGSSLVSPKTDDRKTFSLTKGSDASETTYFSTTTLDFATATKEQIAGLAAATTKSVVVTKGSTYSFVQGDLKGIAKITDLTTGLEGSVTVDVKWVTVSPLAEVAAK